MNRRRVAQPVFSQTANGAGRMISIIRFVKVLLARGKKNPGCVRQFDMQKGEARTNRRLDTVEKMGQLLRSIASSRIVKPPLGTVIPIRLPFPRYRLEDHSRGIAGKSTGRSSAMINRR